MNAALPLTQETLARPENHLNLRLRRPRRRMFFNSVLVAITGALLCNAATVDPEFRFKFTLDGTQLASAYLGLVQELNNGDLLLAGTFSSVNSIPATNNAVIGADRTIRAFSPDLSKSQSFSYSAVEMTNGDLVVGGEMPGISSQKKSNCVLRYRRSGTRVPGFELQGIDLPANAWIWVPSIIRNADDKFTALVSRELKIGSRSTTTNIVARFMADGRQDTTFQPFTFHSGFGYDFGKIFSNSKGLVYVIGNFGTNPAVARIVRLLENGQSDPSFNPVLDGSPRYARASINDAVILNDDRIAIAGAFTMVNGVPRICMAIIGADGQVDETFKTAEGFDAPVAVLGQTANGIVAAGWFTNYSGSFTPNVAFIDSTGNLSAAGMSNGISVSNEPPAFVRRATVTQDGSAVMLGGYFDRIDSESASGFARLSIDSPTSEHFSIEKQSDKYRVIFSGFPGWQRILMESRDLIDWTPLQTNMLLTNLYLFEVSGDVDSSSFFRVKSTLK